MPTTQKNHAPLVAPSREDYTAAQRRAIDARLSLAKGGKRYGPFTADEAEAFLKTEVKARKKRTPKAS